ncbi:MAG: acyltransferase family protein [Deltaproteobacteria bacterium]|nr:acyltransferase family protein [Deltaproteobacteria bacterium]
MALARATAYHEPHVPKDSPERIATLDGLRALSIVAVIFSHTLGTHMLGGGMVPDPDRLRVLADLGVRTFFIISGFLITTLLVREREKSGRISLAGFYLRRTFRIFPAFYVFLGVVLVLATIGWISVPRDDLIYAATYTMNFHAEREWWVGHLWSLAVEEQFYLLWPLAVVMLGVRRALIVALVGIMLAPVLRIGAWICWPEVRPLTDQAFPFVFDALATGCVLAIGRDWLETQPLYLTLLDAPTFWLLPAAGIVALSISTVWFNLGAGVTLGNIAIAMAIHRCVRHPDLRVGRFLESRMLVWVGSMSYSLYLWQQLFVDRHSEFWANAFPLNLVLAAAAAIVSFYLVERPVLRWRARRRKT